MSGAGTDPNGVSQRGRLESVTMDDGVAIGCYRSPAVGERIGGLVLIQEIFGLTDHIREQCDRFADAGFDVIAPAIFHREAPGLNLGYGEADVAEAIRLVRAHPIDRALADAARCVALLGQEGPVFMTGFCYGGSVTWLSACSDIGLTAAAGYYGSLIPSRSALTPLCPTILHFGMEDAEIPLADIEAFALARPDVEVLLYPAGHGFNSDRRQDYHRESAVLAFERTVSHFKSSTLA